jgi:hypothetical protein
MNIVEGGILELLQIEPRGVLHELHAHPVREQLPE